MDLLHPSVEALLQTVDRSLSPEDAIRRRARSLVDEVRGTLGWEGPPFDPRALASYRGLKVRRSYHGFTAKQDACITPGLVAVNGNKPARRQRYSIAHEVIHTLFPDYEVELRRVGTFWRQEDDDAEVERLCQIGAAELLLPEFAFVPRLRQLEFSLTTAGILYREFDASIEATTRRMVELHDRPAAVVFLRPSAGDLPSDERGRSSGYSPYLPLHVAVACRSPACTKTAVTGAAVPKASVAIRAWKRAGYPPLAATIHCAIESWPDLFGTDSCCCEAMVLPENSHRPHEVMCLIKEA